MTPATKLALTAAAIMAGLFAVPSARAEGVPDLKGTWTLDGSSFAAARVGSENKYFGDLPKPAFGKPDQAFTFVIDEQDGRAFHGHAVGPNGKKEIVVGVIRFDDASLLMSGDSGIVDGRIVGDKVELCWIDALDKWNAVSCGLYGKSK